MSEGGRLEAIGSLIHSQQPGGLQCPNPPAFFNLPKGGILLLASVDDNYQQFGFEGALAGEMDHHKRFVHMTMGDVETMAVHPGVERLPGFSNILETTPPAMN